MAPVSTAELSEARDILRLAQSNRAAAPMDLVPLVSEVDRLFDEVESSVVPPTLE
jgi:hypothetical protein